MHVLGKGKARMINELKLVIIDIRKVGAIEQRKERKGMKHVRLWFN